MKKNYLINTLNNLRFIIFCLFVMLFTIARGAMEVCFIIIFFLWLVEKALTDGWRIKDYFPKTKLNLPILFFMAILLASAIGSIELALSLRKFFSKWFQYIMTFFIAVDTLNSKKRLNITLGLLSLSLTLVLVNGFWQLFSGSDFFASQSIEGRWIRGHFSGLNPFGAFVVLMLPPAVAFLFSQKKKVKIIAIVLALMALGALIFSCSLISWVGLVISLILVLFLSKKPVVKFLPVVLLVIVLIISLTPPFKGRISETVYGNTYGEGGRIQIWKQNIQEISKDPIIGKGINTTSVELARQYSQLPLVIKANPHNWYLLLALEAGIFALLAWLWLLIRAFKAFFESRKDALWYGLFIGFSAFIILNLADNIWDERIQSAFWFILGLIIVNKRLKLKYQPITKE